VLSPDFAEEGDNGDDADEDEDEDDDDDDDDDDTDGPRCCLLFSPAISMKLG